MGRFPAIVSRFVPALFASAVLVACDGGAGGASADLRREAMGERGLLSFELEADHTPSQGANDFSLSLREAATGAPVAGASIDVSALMPSMGHPASAASIEEMGGGEYHIEGLALSMPGRWDVHVVASREGTSDEAHFTYDIP
jgi:hypothetical protein